MTNSPQIPTIPQDVVEAIENYAYACSSAAQDLANVSDRKERADCKQFLLTAIAAHLRPVVPELLNHVDVSIKPECIAHLLVIDPEKAEPHEFHRAQSVIKSLLRPVVPVEVKKLFFEALYARDCYIYAEEAYKKDSTEKHKIAMAESHSKAEEAKYRLLAAYQPTTQPNKSSGLPDVGDKDVVESGWLIEFLPSVSRTPTYYGRTDEGLGQTTDHLMALRFSRKEDAEAIIADTTWTEAIATEHQWGC